METATLLTFAAAALALAVTPGPDMLMVLTRAVAQGRMAGLVSTLGISLGCYVHAVVAGLSLSGVLLLAPFAFDAIRYAGAAYLLWLAFQALRGSGGLQLEQGTVAPISFWAVLRQGFLCNVLNPKVALFFLALFPQFMEPRPDTALQQALILASILNVAGAIVLVPVSLLGSRFGDWLRRRPGFLAWQNRLLGLVFAGLALRLAFDARR
ncbi:LysE family translocator [Ferrovibrio sp. MS7]|uniref:LysE family translocator n=1 Tax=Ferrovibrio plantarum TaxID=3119164 RepID=UPI0031372ED4